MAALAADYGGGGSNYLVQTPAGVLYAFAIDGASDVYFRKSTDGGITWGDATVVFAGTATQLAVWYDEWSGVSGGKIRLAYAESVTDDVLYRDLDVDTDTLGTQTTIYAGTDTAGNANALSIVTARGGNLVCVYDIDGGAEDGAAKSTDGGATWGAIADPTEGAADMWLLAPGWNADSQDVQLIFWDVSADEISVKRYDDSGDAWAETSISTGMVEQTQGTAYPHFAVAVDTTNSQNVVIAWNGIDTANADLKCWTVTDSAVTAKTDVVTNVTDDCGLAALSVDVVSGRWTAFWAGNTDGSETWVTSVSVYSSTSTDGGTTWSSPLQVVYTPMETRTLFTANRGYGGQIVSRVVALGDQASTAGGLCVSVPLRGLSASFQLGL